MITLEARSAGQRDQAFYPGGLPEMLLSPQNGDASVGNNVPGCEARAGIKQMLVPVDFSPWSRRAAELALAEARKCGASLSLLHVIDTSAQGGGGRPDDAQGLMKHLWNEGLREMKLLAKSLRADGVRVETLLVEGLPWEEIVNHSNAYDLVVLGRKPSRPFWRLFAKHTARRVTRQALCPVRLLV